MWLHIPKEHLTESACARDTTGSGSELPWLNPAIEQSVTWREKLSHQQTWRQRWKKNAWLRRLSGLTLKPSTASRGAESFISSLRESHASHGAPRASEPEHLMNAGFGTISTESFRKSDPHSVSLKKSGDLFPAVDYHTFSAICQPSGMIVRGAYSEHPTWTPRTKGKDCLCFAVWPTPASRDYRDGNSEKHCLKTGSGRKHMGQLPNFVLYGQPDPDDGNTNGNPRGRLGRTPRAGDADHGGQNARDSSGALHLSAQAANWPTPRCCNGKRSSGAPRSEFYKKMPGKQGKLNPRWVETLMGLPIGWTSCDYAVMASYLSWQQSHGRFLKTALKNMTTNQVHTGG